MITRNTIKFVIRVLTRPGFFLQSINAEKKEHANIKTITTLMGFRMRKNKVYQPIHGAF